MSDKPPRRPIYSRYTVFRDSDLSEPFPWHFTSVAYDDRFDYGHVETFDQAIAIATKLARTGVETDE